MGNERDDDAPDVPISCPECGTSTRVPLREVMDVLARHNDRRHNGETVAEVDPALKEQLADLVARDLGLLDEARE